MNTEVTQATTSTHPRPPSMMSSTPPNDVLLSCLEHAKISMLSVGSGDGSQQLAIARAGHTNILTTFWDTEQQLLKKYPHARQILRELQKSSPPAATGRTTRQTKKPTKKPTKTGGPLLFGVDATQLHHHQQLRGKKFDVIFFTFPHTGIPNSKYGSIRSNQELIRGFLASAARLLKNPTSQIQITVKNGEPYRRWDVPRLLNSRAEKEFGLAFVGSKALEKQHFPGYVHRLTKGVVGKLDQVMDKSGAQVHFFAPASSSANQTAISTDGAGTATTPTVATMPPQLCWPSPDNQFHHIFVLPLLCMAEASFLGNSQSSIPFMEPPGPPRSSGGSSRPSSAAWTDEQVRIILLEQLKGQAQNNGPPLTVLELRRQGFDEPLPDVRQLNRVLYGLCKQREQQVMQLPPAEPQAQVGGGKKTNKKPRWAYIGLSS